MDPILVSILGAAKALGLSRSKTYELIQSGDRSVVKIGRRTLVTVASIHSFVSSREF